MSTRKERATSKTEKGKRIKNIVEAIMPDSFEDSAVKGTMTTEEQMATVTSKEECDGRFYNMRYRDCPLPISRNMEGLVDGTTFWKNKKGLRQSLYDSDDSFTKTGALQAVFFPVKNMRYRKDEPNDGPAHMSLMAQYLYHQMKQEPMNTTTKTHKYIVEAERNECHVESKVGIVTKNQECKIQKKADQPRAEKHVRSLFCCACIADND